MCALNTSVSGNLLQTPSLRTQWSMISNTAEPSVIILPFYINFSPVLWKGQPVLSCKKSNTAAEKAFFQITFWKLFQVPNHVYFKNVLFYFVIIISVSDVYCQSLRLALICEASSGALFILFSRQEMNHPNKSSPANYQKEGVPCVAEDHVIVFVYFVGIFVHGGCCPGGRRVNNLRAFINI